MDGKKNIDNSIRQILNAEAKNVSLDRDIFEEAWKSKDSYKENTKSRGYNIRRKAMAACMALVFMTSIVYISPTTRTIAMDLYDGMRTVFLLDKDNSIIEVQENTRYEFENLGGVAINVANKDSIESNLGFNIYLPETVAEEYGIQGRASAGITIFDVTLKEIEDNRDIFVSSIENNHLYNSLSNFKMNRSVCAHYSDSKRGNFVLYLNKHRLDLFPSFKTIREINEGSLSFKVVESTRAFYPWKDNGSWRYEDMTQAPEKIVTLTFLLWEDEGVTYTLASPGKPGDVELDINEAIKFANIYMKEKKQQ